MLNIVIALVILVWMVVRQLTRRPLKERSALGWIMLAYGIVEIARFTPSHPVSPLDIGVLVASTAIGCLLAAARAFTIRLEGTGAGATQQGNAWTAVLWMIGIGQHLLSEAFVSVPGLTQTSLLAYFGFVVLVQRQVLMGRARARGHFQAGENPATVRREGDAPPERGSGPGGGRRAGASRGRAQ